MMWYRIVACVGFILLSARAGAYYEFTHADMSQYALSNSVLTQAGSTVLGDLGLFGSVDDESQTFSNGTPRSITNLIRDGAIFEDSLVGLRPRNHFFDPINNRPLTSGGIALGATSPDWALEDNGQITGFLTFGSQDFSFADARGHFYTALTSKTANDQKTFFGRTFQRLGQVIHHIQDMAQPQHVRNDRHLSIGQFDSVTPFANPSRYEIYTRDRPDLPFLGSEFFDGSLPIPIVRPRDFWATQTQPGPNRGTGAGLAEFTNNNFVSAGTNFLLLNDMAVPGQYFLPIPDDFAPPLRIDHVFGSDESVPQNIRNRCRENSAGCYMTFYSSTVWDKRLNQTYTNPRASTLSVYDQDLRAISGRVTYTNPDTGETFTTDRLFALNSFNFDYVNRFLIPRAVAYSAGMINYFFRGKIDLVPDPGNTARFLIQNLGSEPLNGTFEFYYDAADGNRYQVLDADAQPLKFRTDGTLAPGQNLPVAAFAPPTDPEPKKPLAYMLVFRGDMGEEKATAVVAKLVIARTGLGLYLLGVDARGMSVTMKVDRRGLRVISGPDATGAFVQNNQEFDPFRGGLPTNNSTGVVAQAHQLKQVVFQPSVTGDVSYKVLSVAVGEVTPPIVNGFESLSVNALHYTLDSTQSHWVSQGPNTSWLANSPLGTFTFSLMPKITFISSDGFARVFFAPEGTLQYSVKLADGSTSSGSVPLPPLANLVGNDAYTHGDYDGFRSGTLFVSGDGLTLSGLKPRSPVPNDPSSMNINYSALQISPTIPPTVSLVSNGSTTKVTLTDEIVIRNIVTPVGGGLCFNQDTSVMTYVLNAKERFYIGYINNSLSEYTRTITNSGGFSEGVGTCTVSLPTFTQFLIHSAGGRKAQWDYSFGLSYADANQSETLGGSRTTTVPPTGPDIVTPGQTTITISETNVVRILTNDTSNVVTTLQTASSSTVPPARLRFRGADLGLSEFVADSSPLGEVFFATSDMGMVVHVPTSRMPAITRGDIPAHVVKLLAAIWL